MLYGPDIGLTLVVGEVARWALPVVGIAAGIIVLWAYFTRRRGEP